MLAGFDGTIPLFPLPNLVMFPGLAQPLHVFETRYRQMTADALAGNRLIAMALLQPGYESSYESKDCAIHPMICVGTITHEQALGDGRYNFLFRGLKRATIVEEVTTEKLYRVARVDLQDSMAGDSFNGELPKVKEKLVTEIVKAIPSLGQSDSFSDMIADNSDVGMLCDLACFSCRFQPELAQKVLNELDVSKRYKLVREIFRLRQMQEKGDQDFPPEFSIN